MVYQKNSPSSNNEYYTYNGWEYESMIRVSDEEEDRLNTGLRKGLWTDEEDSKLTSSVAIHGEGRWNTLALLAGLKRSGKSCRLRWLNYLRPDLRRGTFTLDEQLIILELHFRWGNRWSKIAEHLPGRTDNEIKNYWRTKVQKLARQFHCHVNCPEFKHALRHTWIPRLVEQIQASSSAISNTTKAQIEGPCYESRYGLYGGNSSSSTSSDNRFLFDTPAGSWAPTSLDQYVDGPPDLYSKPIVLIDSREAHVSLESDGLNSGNSSRSTSSENCCLLDKSWAPTSLDQHVVGPNDLHSNPNTLTDSCGAHILPESGSSANLDLNWEQIDEFLWEMTLNDGENMLFLEHQQD